MSGKDLIETYRPSRSPALDPCTKSNYYDFKVLHTTFDFTVSFDSKSIYGKVRYNLKVAENATNVKDLILDCSHLEIKLVKVNDLSADYKVCDRTEPLGSPLLINLPEDIGAQEFTVDVDYSTTEKCTALQFIRGDTGSYLFSQCQSIHARSLVPCFDTPAVKSSFTSRVKSPLPVLMSGRPVDSNEQDLYCFSQPIPIPSYLFAIASGNLVSAPIGPRSKVYSETPNIKACQWEFEQDMEDFLQVAEKLAFKYEWQTFDVLVLPMSFPYGGMENPNITFATPSLICKDRSQVKVIAHELAHSWAGNLVTNCSWEHFWLNEGWTVYFERRILRGVAAFKAKRNNKALSDDDAEQYGEKYRHFSSILGWNGLEESMSSIPEDHTSLVWDLSNGDPDEFYSRIPYEKGFNFLYFLERSLGIEEFDKFIPHYFMKFRYTSIDSFQFVDELYEFFEPRGKKFILDQIDFKAWLFGKGLPEKPDFDTSLVDQCTSLTEKWIASLKTIEDPKQLLVQFDQEKDIMGFDANQHLVFLEDLCIKLEPVDVNPQFVRAIIDIYPYYKQSENFEIIFDFNNLLIKNGKFSEEDEIVKQFSNWLGTVGRMKYVRPGYRLLKQYVSNDLAKATFERFKDLYHPICKNLVRKDLEI